MTIAAVIVIVLLAGVAALVSVAGERYNVVSGAQGGYLRSFYKIEAFWRAFITNLSFGGVSLALAMIAFQSKWGFWDFNNPILPLLFNFIVGLLAPHELKDIYDKPSPWAWKFSAGALVVYAYTGVVAFFLFPGAGISPPQ